MFARPRRHFTAAMGADRAALGHDPGNALGSCGIAEVGQLALDSGCTIGAPRGDVDVIDVVGEPRLREVVPDNGRPSHS